MVGALVLLVCVGVGWWFNEAPTKMPVLIRLTWDSGLTTDPAISPDGKLVAFASDRGGEGDLPSAGRRYDAVRGRLCGGLDWIGFRRAVALPGAQVDDRAGDNVVDADFRAAAVAFTAALLSSARQWRRLRPQRRTGPAKRRERRSVRKRLLAARPRVCLQLRRPSPRLNRR
jgi:WD40-like Beta Propeller Repeat